MEGRGRKGREGDVGPPQLKFDKTSPGHVCMTSLYNTDIVLPTINLIFYLI